VTSENYNITGSAPTETDVAVRSGDATTDDGLGIHWRLVGRGPAIVCCNGVGVGTFFWKYLVAHFSSTHSVLVWDYRGHGRSDRRLDPHTADMGIERHADDLAIVLDAAAAECPESFTSPALLVGHSMGCQVALETRRRHPERVAGLVLMLGTAGKALQTFFDNPRSPAFFRMAHRIIFRSGPRSNELIRPLLKSPAAWKFATQFSLVDPYYTKQEDMLPYLDHLASLDQRLFIENVLKTNDHDAWDLLPELDLPLLVIAAENDKFTPMWCSEKMVELTKDAELLVLADASHAALIEQPETINFRLERFIRERMWAD
jgi:pimeloyl-ACP methyl ester carboxylesterase